MVFNYNEYIVRDSFNARQALQRLDTISSKESRTLFIVNDNEKLLGTVTDGDIRRGLLSGREISENVSLFMNRSFKFFLDNKITQEEVKFYKQERIDLLPVLDKNGKILKILDLKIMQAIVPATVFIMAGGRGERLKPLTDTIPKPLLKVGNKPIIEHNIDRLIQFGIEDFFISIRYLGQSIKQYLGNGDSKGVRIRYIEETQALGTIGALALAEEVQHESLLVMNSDILTTLDFRDFYTHFRDTDSAMSVASVPYSINIPYGVLELTDENKVLSLKEKPSYVYYSNAGIYFLKNDVRNNIPLNKLYNATDLMNDLISSGKSVSNFPILNYWLDIGTQQDFMKAQIDIKHLDL